ncbi:sugar ABC transporter permease [Lichenihabitans sp. Uapishka_5]|uniref:carbohydrate ABC transporter permease n=1 Tax=Lichenihabitans sp. Uapishka_5 TaxID=3037302 RepID=UPI0029E7F59A|nr:sugar ABC transporter permease [Lichenihabitans sp. Uapishka_5]MDX7951173.1 sugar ABC transporter permease [Lichenihabitans sp. Uapishka_5]
MPLPRKRTQTRTALGFIGPFVLAYAVLFLYPTAKMVELSFTNAPLVGGGHWVGWANYIRLARDALFLQSVGHTIYFVVLTVIPTTLLGLVIALAVSRLSGKLQSLVLAAFFLPYILPVSVVFRIWEWMLDPQFGIAQWPVRLLTGHTVAMWSDPLWAMPSVAFITIWWTNGFNVLLFIAGLRNISQDVRDAAALDGAGAMAQFRFITWPLIWPVTALVLTIQLILQLKIFDQIYLMTQGGPFNSTYVVVQYIYKQAFQGNRGGYGATVAVALFVAIAALSTLQFQALRARSA